jgi:hypothetical protein
MSYDEDPPTRRLPMPPREPNPREPLPPRDALPPSEQRPPAGSSDVQLYALEQQLKSLRSWLVALAAVAVVALGVAAVALVTGGDDASSDDTTPAGLRKSVERLEGRIDDRATKGDLSDLKNDIDALKTSVSDAGSGDATTTSQTDAPDVSGLQSDLSDLSSRVDALEQAASSSGDGGTDGTDTTTDGTAAP